MGVIVTEDMVKKAIVESDLEELAKHHHFYEWSPHDQSVYVEQLRLVLSADNNPDFQLLVNSLKPDKFQNLESEWSTLRNDVANTLLADLNSFDLQYLAIRLK
jgi:hypothetical protein